MAGRYAEPITHKSSQYLTLAQLPLEFLGFRSYWQVSVVSGSWRAWSSCGTSDTPKQNDHFEGWGGHCVYRLTMSLLADWIRNPKQPFTPTLNINWLNLKQTLIRFHLALYIPNHEPVALEQENVDLTRTSDRNKHSFLNFPAISFRKRLSSVSV